MTNGLLSKYYKVFCSLLMNFLLFVPTYGVFAKKTHRGVPDTGSSKLYSIVLRRPVYYREHFCRASDCIVMVFGIDPQESNLPTTCKCFPGPIGRPTLSSESAASAKAKNHIFETHCTQTQAVSCVLSNVIAKVQPV